LMSLIINVAASLASTKQRKRAERILS